MHLDRADTRCGPNPPALPRDETRVMRYG